MSDCNENDHGNNGDIPEGILEWAESLQTPRTNLQRAAVNTAQELVDRIEQVLRYRAQPGVEDDDVPARLEEWREQRRYWRLTRAILLDFVLDRIDGHLPRTVDEEVKAYRKYLKKRKPDEQDGAA